MGVASIVPLLLLYLAAVGALTRSAGSPASPPSCSTGTWAAPRDQRLCSDRHLCSETNKTWALPGCSPPVFEEAACDLLRSRGITEIYFMGDSYMRHIYQAAILTLTGNYRDGSVDAIGKSKCTYRHQYDEKDCSTRHHRNNPAVCDKTILLHLADVPVSPTKVLTQKGAVVLVSYGNHPAQSGRGRFGINNASAWMDVLDKWHCKASRGERNGHIDVYNGIPHVWWVSTHARIKGNFPDERADLVTQYNLDMRDRLPSVCPTFGYIDVFNLTHALSQDPAEHHGLSYDQVHWGMEVNLNKWQIIQDALVHHSVPDSDSP